MSEKIDPYQAALLERVKHQFPRMPQPWDSAEPKDEAPTLADLQRLIEAQWPKERFTTSEGSLSRLHNRPFTRSYL